MWLCKLILPLSTFKISLMDIAACLKSMFVLFILLITTSVQSQTKRALIIAIGNYKYWPHISSDNDVPFIKSTLLKQNFEEKNITVVEDSAATMTGIENAFKKLILNSVAGDIVVIHVSSHGEQIQDDNHDEIDGLDESIVTWDAAYPINSENYSTAQAKYFRDDEFGSYINQLRSKLGKKGDIAVFLDACHSGSGTRGSHKVRGNAPPLVSKSFVAPPKSRGISTNVFLEKDPKNINQKNLATYIVISAALAEENNTEANYDDDTLTPGGSLSIAITKAFANLKPGTTYRSLFADIVSDMNTLVQGQHPVIEGDGLDYKMFGGDFVKQEPYVEIQEINENKLVLKGGLMAGLDIGAKVALYPSKTQDTDNKEPIATGTITSAEPFKSEVTLDKDPGLQDASDGWVFITEPVYKIHSLVIGFGSKENGNAVLNFSEDEETELKNELKEIPLVSLDGDAELMLVKGAQNDTLKIAANGYVFGIVNKNNSKNLQEQIRRYAQYKFLQNLQVSDPSCYVDVRLLALKNGKADTTLLNNNTNTVPEFNVGDKILVWAKNNGDKPVYLNILDLQPDGIINPIFPNSTTDPVISKDDLKIDPGQEILFKDYKITIRPPVGTEIFKIFVSQTKINMEGIANTKGAAPRGNFSALEKLLNNSYNISTRGTKVENEQKAEGSTYDVLFTIKPPLQ